jgi:hypothetical protein
MSLIYKSNKYKLKYHYGGGLGLRSGSINTIIREIKQRLDAYAENYNTLSYKQQITANNFTDVNGLGSWGELAFDDDDEENNKIITTINQYLPNFSFIWNEYYKELIIAPRRTSIFSNFSYDSPPSSKEVLKLLFSELSKLEKNPQYDDPIIRKTEDEEEILRRLQEEKERLEREENERLEKQRVEEERKLEIRRRQVESLIPISEFCIRGYNSQQRCIKENCSKLHFPEPFYNSRKGKTSNQCPNEVTGMCQNYRKLCTRFHAEQERFKFYESEVLIGIKKSGLDTVPNKGRIIGQRELDYLKKLEEEKQRNEELKRQKLDELASISDEEIIKKRVCLLNNPEICGRIESRIRITHGDASGGYFTFQYKVRLDDQTLYTGDDIFLRELTPEEKEARKQAKLAKHEGVTRGTSSKEKRVFKPESLPLINPDDIGEIEPIEELTESEEVVVTLPMVKEIFEENMKQLDESILDIEPEIEYLKQFQVNIQEYYRTLKESIKEFAQIKSKLVLKLKDNDLTKLQSETDKLKLIIKDFELLITSIDLKIKDAEFRLSKIVKNTKKNINIFIKKYSDTDERLFAVYNELNSTDPSKNYAIPNYINNKILSFIKELRQYQQEHRINRKRLQEILKTAFDYYGSILRSFRK